MNLFEQSRTLQHIASTSCHADGVGEADYGRETAVVRSLLDHCFFSVPRKSCPKVVQTLLESCPQVVFHGRTSARQHLEGSRVVWTDIRLLGKFRARRPIEHVTLRVVREVLPGRSPSSEEHALGVQCDPHRLVGLEHLVLPSDCLRIGIVPMPLRRRCMAERQALTSARSMVNHASLFAVVTRAPPGTFVCSVCRSGATT